MAEQQLGWLSVIVSGPNVTEGDVREVGEHVADLIGTVSEVISGTRLPVKVGAIRRLCDGCGKRAPDFDLPPGWTHVGSDDYCADCSLHAPADTADTPTTSRTKPKAE